MGINLNGDADLYICECLGYDCQSKEQAKMRIQTLDGSLYTEANQYGKIFINENVPHRVADFLDMQNQYRPGKAVSLEERVEWCKEYLEGGFILTFNGGGNFAFKEDAALFKLTWY